MAPTTDFNGHQSGTPTQKNDAESIRLALSPQLDTFVARGHRRQKRKRKDKLLPTTKGKRENEIIYCLLIIVCFLFSSFTVSAVTKYTTGFGSPINWNGFGVWTTVGPCGNFATSASPISTDDVVICNKTVNANGNFTCNNLTIQGTGILAFSSGTPYTITVNGNLIMDGTAQITAASVGSLNVAGTFTVPAAATNVRIAGINVTVTGSTTIDGFLNWNSISGTKTLTSDVTVNGTLTSTANESITVRGNFTNNGTFTSGTGIYTFDGTAAQTIGGTVTSTFSNLTIANTSATGVTLNQDVNVGGILTLTDGYLYTSNTNLLTMNSGSSVSGVSNSSFVYGPVAKVGSTNFTFPVGKDVQYRPISITLLSGSETFTAEYFNFDPNAANAQDPLAPYSVASKDASLDHIGRCEYWILNRAALINAWVTLSWNTYSCGVDNLIDIAVARWDGAVWRDHLNGGTTGSIDPGTGTVITSAIVTAFSPFTLASKGITNPLPVELLSFDAKHNGNIVEVTWTTASEWNNDYFTVEHSKDGMQFDEVTRVDGAGNSSTVINYSATDYEPYGNTSYYRLKQTDFDGQYKYSEIIAVESCRDGLTENLTIYPNPANGTFNLLFNGDKEQVRSIEIFNVMGERVCYLGHFQSVIDLSDKPSGMYSVHFNLISKSIIQKIVIEK